MTLPIIFILFLGFLYLGSSAVDVKGHVSWNDVCRGKFLPSSAVASLTIQYPGYNQLGHSRVVLDNDKHSGGILKDGSFVIPNVPSGTYLLSVISHDYQFEQMRVDVKDSISFEEPVVEIRPYVLGTPMSPASTILLPYPIKLSARQRFNYFVPRDSFNIMGMLKSPMILMMVFAGALVLGMPYLMKNMDPESLAEFKREQAKMSHAQSALQSGDFKSGLSALMTAASGQDQASSQPPRVQTATKSKGKSRRR
ncbi:hypothetical protein C8R41DRAFT_919316 [Lentinula lateritia]|uniref:ER membrane protein complex subunit 7 beta-sandwich domain-containing protein n=1 Tax=Lentinula lateritia TaxID=40482 RepID=A0ABQ8VHD9_9AGAR|nr:hypothetical protein C8R41DRAFT_919316 [Lentinula lateritia]